MCCSSRKGTLFHVLDGGWLSPSNHRLSWVEPKEWFWSGVVHLWSANATKARLCGSSAKGSVCLPKHTTPPPPRNLGTLCNCIPTTVKLLETLCQRLSGYLFSLLSHALSVTGTYPEGKKLVFYEDPQASNFVFPVWQDPQSSVGPHLSWVLW